MHAVFLPRPRPEAPKAKKVKPVNTVERPSMTVIVGKILLSCPLLLLFFFGKKGPEDGEK